MEYVKTPLEHAVQTLRAENAQLREQLATCQAECEEQARLNGIGSEREAAIMAKLEACQKDAERYQMHVKLWSERHGVPEDEVTRELDAEQCQNKENCSRWLSQAEEAAANLGGVPVSFTPFKGTCDKWKEVR